MLSIFCFFFTLHVMKPANDIDKDYFVIVTVLYLENGKYVAQHTNNNSITKHAHTHTPTHRRQN